MTEKILIKIEVHIDTLCPWCYLSKRSLESAMKRFQGQQPDVEFEVLWRPFYLYPMLEHGCDKTSFYQKEAQHINFQALQDKIRAVGSRYDIKFSFEGRTGPSRNSHKLIALTLQQRDSTVQAKVVEALFKGHFEKGRDITDTEWLVSVGIEEAKMSPSDVRRALSSEEAGTSVDDEVRSASVDRDVKAVPCVTLQGRYRVGGFQEQQVFEDLFAKIVKNGGN